MSNTLIEKAKNHKKDKRLQQRQYTIQEVSLAIEYIKGNLTNVQVIHALGINKNSGELCYRFAFQAIRYALQNNIIQINQN